MQVVHAVNKKHISWRNWGCCKLYNALLEESIVGGTQRRQRQTKFYRRVLPSDLSSHLGFPQPASHPYGGAPPLQHRLQEHFSGSRVAMLPLPCWTYCWKTWNHWGCRDKTWNLIASHGLCWFMLVYHLFPIFFFHLAILGFQFRDVARQEGSC